MSDLTEARAELARQYRGYVPGEEADVEAAIDALLLAYRSALAGEDFDASLKAFADKVCESFVALGPRFTGGNLAPSVALLADVVSVAKEHAWRLRAPLLVQLQDKEERIKELEKELNRERGDAARLAFELAVETGAIDLERDAP